MANEVILRLELRDVYGDGVREKVDIILRHQVLSEVKKASANASTTIDIKGLRALLRVCIEWISTHPHINT